MPKDEENVPFLFVHVTGNAFVNEYAFGLGAIFAVLSSEKSVFMDDYAVMIQVSKYLLLRI